MVLRCVSYLAVIHLIVSVWNLVRGCKRAPERVTFTNLGVPAVYSSASIHKECAKQVFANAPMSGMGYKIYKTNKGKSSLTSLVACFILGKVDCKTN